MNWKDILADVGIVRQKWVDRREEEIWRSGKEVDRNCVMKVAPGLEYQVLKRECAATLNVVDHIGGEAYGRTGLPGDRPCIKQRSTRTAEDRRVLAAMAANISHNRWKSSELER